MAGKPRKTTAMFWDRPSYQLVGTYTCHVFAFRNIPELNPAPLRTQGPTIIRPGDLIHYASGRKTSAGFPGLHMLDGFSLRYVSAGNRKGTKFFCLNCGHEAHADVNAAKNILAAGLAVIACGEYLDVTGSMKQEPTGGDYAFA